MKLYWEGELQEKVTLANIITKINDIVRESLRNSDYNSLTIRSINRTNVLFYGGCLYMSFEAYYQTDEGGEMNSEVFEFKITD